MTMIFVYLFIAANMPEDIQHLSSQIVMIVTCFLHSFMQS